MEGRAQILTERLKRVFSQQASGIDYAILLAPLPVIGYLISLAQIWIMIRERLKTFKRKEE